MAKSASPSRAHHSAPAFAGVTGWNPGLRPRHSGFRRNDEVFIRHGPSFVTPVKTGVQASYGGRYGSLDSVLLQKDHNDEDEGQNEGGLLRPPPPDPQLITT